jgi:hypothetical protein
MADTHIGEGGKHFLHSLELLTDGRVYCNTCECPLGWWSADVAWPEEKQAPADTTGAREPSELAGHEWVSNGGKEQRP